MISLARTRSEGTSARSIASRVLALGAVVVLAALTACGRHEAANPAGAADDLSRLGAAKDIQFWTLEQKRIGLRNMDRIFATRPIRRSGPVKELPLAPPGLGWSTITYQYNGKTSGGSVAGRVRSVRHHGADHLHQSR